MAQRVLGAPERWRTAPARIPACGRLRTRGSSAPGQGHQADSPRASSRGAAKRPPRRGVGVRHRPELGGLAMREPREQNRRPGPDRRRRARCRRSEDLRKSRAKRWSAGNGWLRDRDEIVDSSWWSAPTQRTSRSRPGKNSPNFRNPRDSAAGAHVRAVRQRTLEGGREAPSSSIRHHSPPRVTRDLQCDAPPTVAESNSATSPDGPH
jgi:hypothetical protein